MTTETRAFILTDTDGDITWTGPYPLPRAEKLAREDRRLRPDRSARVLTLEDAHEAALIPAPVYRLQSKDADGRDVALTSVGDDVFFQTSEREAWLTEYPSREAAVGALLTWIRQQGLTDPGTVTGQHRSAMLMEAVVVRV